MCLNGCDESFMMWRCLAVVSFYIPYFRTFSFPVLSRVVMCCYSLTVIALCFPALACSCRVVCCADWVSYVGGDL
jgi:hypothetical protein